MTPTMLRKVSATVDLEVIRLEESPASCCVEHWILVGNAIQALKEAAKTLRVAADLRCEETY